MTALAESQPSPICTVVRSDRKGFVRTARRGSHNAFRYIFTVCLERVVMANSPTYTHALSQFSPEENRYIRRIRPGQIIYMSAEMSIPRAAICAPTMSNNNRNSGENLDDARTCVCLPACEPTRPSYYKNVAHFNFDAGAVRQRRAGGGEPIGRDRASVFVLIWWCAFGPSL